MKKALHYCMMLINVCFQDSSITDDVIIIFFVLSSLLLGVGLYNTNGGEISNYLCWRDFKKHDGS